jgi:hypothetical protein
MAGKNVSPYPRYKSKAKKNKSAEGMAQLVTVPA